MTLEVLDISPGDISRAWECFPKSPMQRVLHNDMVREIFSLRDKLESAKPEDVIGLQAQIRAAKHFLGLLHRKDVLPTK